MVPEKLYFGQWPYKTKQLSNQCHLTAQIEQVQDKVYYTKMHFRHTISLIQDKQDEASVIVKSQLDNIWHQR